MTDPDELVDAVPTRVVDLASIVAGVLADAPRLGSTRLVCIDGPSGAGKTTLAARVRTTFRQATESRVSVVHMDSLYNGWHGLVDAAYRRVPEWLLTPLAAEAPARFRRYDWHRGRYAEWHEVGPGGVLVLEGCGSAAGPADAYANLRLWVDTSPSVRRRRGLDRSGPEVLPYLLDWAVEEDAHFAVDRTRCRADLVVLGDTSVPYDAASQMVVQEPPDDGAACQTQRAPRRTIRLTAPTNHAAVRRNERPDAPSA